MSACKEIALWFFLSLAFGLGVLASEQYHRAEQLSESLRQTETRLVQCQNNISTVSQEAAKSHFLLRQAMTYGIPLEMSRLVYRTALEHALKPRVLYRLVEQESGFRHWVVSPVGAIGLTQIKTSTARMFEPDLEPKELYNEEKNLALGAKYLAYLLDRYDHDYRKALAAYNVGPARHERASSTGEPDGWDYAEEVLR